MPPSPEEARRLLCALGDHVRDLVAGSRDMDMAAVAGETVADTIYAIDRVADDALIDWFEEHWPDVVVVSEGLDEPVPVGKTAAWTVIVDTIDGTRGLMYDKRSAWCLAAAAPPGGGLADIVAAAMTELPTAKQGAADQLSATRGGGLRAERVDLAGGSAARPRRTPVGGDGPRPQLQWAGQILPPREGGPGRAGGRAVRAAWVRGTSSTTSTSRAGDSCTSSSPVGTASWPTSAPWSTTTASSVIPTTCARPCCSRRWAAWSPTPGATPLAVPLDNVSPVAWVGYANEALAARIGPVLAELVDGLGAG